MDVLDNGLSFHHLRPLRKINWVNVVGIELFLHHLSAFRKTKLIELSFASDNTSPSFTSLQEDQLTELSFALDQLSIIYAPSRKSNDFIFICTGIPLHHLRLFRKMKWLNFHLHWITSPSFTPLQEDQFALFLFALEYLFIIYVPSGRWNDWTFICIGSPLHHWLPFRKMNWLYLYLHWITSPSLTHLQEDQLAELSMLWINLSAHSSHVIASSLTSLNQSSKRLCRDCILNIFVPSSRPSDYKLLPCASLASSGDYLLLSCWFFRSPWLHINHLRPFKKSNWRYVPCMW